MLPHYLFLDSANDNNTDPFSSYWMLGVYPFRTS